MSAFDNIIEKKEFQANDFYGSATYKTFRARNNIHDYTTAFGKDQQRFGVYCDKAIHIDFECNQLFLSGDILLKMTAMLNDWQKYTCPVTIKLNNEIIFKGDLFLENVSSGWPSVYFDIPNELLSANQTNSLTLENLSSNSQVIIVHYASLISFQSPAPFRSIANSARVPNFGEAAIPLYLGTDSDDHRQDESGEMERILNYFVNSGLGNLICFRPKKGRNYPPDAIASKQVWLSWLHKCVDNNISIIFHNTDPKVSLLEAKNICGNLFKGFAIHEPYLQFQPVIHGKSKDPEILAAEDMISKKNAYLSYVKKREQPAKEHGINTFVGDPSLLSVYLRDSEVDTILAEPVSNTALLYGAARGTGKTFGAHIPIDWYLGGPHDESKTRRFHILLHLIYAYGGQYAYTENSLFKTVSHERNDWEDKFCLDNRNTLREFGDFVKQNPRRGKVKKNLAVIYGNLESMFWMPDDRIPELIDTEDWDDYIWGKWPNTSYRQAWQTIEAWLPRFNCRKMEQDETFTKLFSGTPYGSVDLILPDSEMDDYKVAAFFGWNTMTENIFNNLFSYVNNGGTLFIAGCHFDTRTVPEGDPILYNDGKISALTGVSINGTESSHYSGIRACQVKNISAKKIDNHLYLHKIGKGRVYFYSFIDFAQDPRMIKYIQNLLREIAGRNNSGISIEGGDSRFINYNVWEDLDGRKQIFLTNIDWDSETPKTITVKTGESSQRIILNKGESIVLES